MAENGTGKHIKLSFLLPLLAFLVLAGFATAALLATLRGERDVSQLPSTMIGKPVPQVDLPKSINPQAIAEAIGREGLDRFAAAFQEITQRRFGAPGGAT